MVENAIPPFDQVKFESDLAELEDPNPKTWYNEARFKAIMVTIISLEVAIFFMCVSTGPIAFDLEMFIDSQKIQIFPVLAAGLNAGSKKAMDALKKAAAKKAVLLENDKATIINKMTDEVAAKDKTIVELERKLYIAEASIRPAKLDEVKKQ